MNGSSTCIAVSVREILEQGKNAYVFFKHEETPDGALHAEELLRKIENPSTAEN